jgi:hypothetical protein
MRFLSGAVGRSFRWALSLDGQVPGAAAGTRTCAQRCLVPLRECHGYDRSNRNGDMFSSPSTP